MIRPVGPMLEYIVYKDYIAEFFCVNKDKTELNCKGKCYLMQRLEEQNEQKKQNLPKIVLEEYPIGFVEIISLFLDKKIPNKHLILTNYSNNYSFLFTYTNFHPPSNFV